MRNPMVWFEIVGQHSDNLHDFYAEVLGWQSRPRDTPRRRGAGAPPVAPRRDFPRRSAPRRRARRPGG